MHALDQHRVKFVLWDTNFETKAVTAFFPAQTRVPHDGFLMEPYLEAHYRLVKSVDGIRIMERNDDNRSH